MRLHLAFTIVALLGLGLSPASAQYMAVVDSAFHVGDPYCGPGISCIVVPVGSPNRAYIVVGSLPGISGAEFRVAGWPSAWPTTVTPNPVASVVLGDPLRPSPSAIVGTNIAFPDCATPNGPWIVLFTLDYIPTTAVSTSCSIQKHQQPSNPNFQCPVLVLCDEPVFTAVCAFAATTTIYSFTVAVQPSSWSQMKALYD